MEEMRRERAIKSIESRLAELNRGRELADINAVSDVLTLLSTLSEESGDRVRFLIRTLSTVDEERCSKWNDFRSSFAGEMKKDLDCCFAVNPVSPWFIHEAASILLIAVGRVVGSLITVRDQTYDWLGDDDILLMATLITAVYLENWLECDEKNYQTPYGFSAHPYKKEDNSRKRTYQELTDGEKSRIQRGFAKQEVYYQLGQKQARKENRPSSYKQYKKDDYGHRVDLIALTMSEAMEDGTLEILEYLYENKYVMDRAEDRRSRRAEGLSRACQQYQSFIREVDGLDTSETASIDSVRKFVASSMMLHKLERANRFHFFARIAERMSDGEIMPDKFYPAAWESFLLRFQGSDSQLFAPFWARAKDTLDSISGGQTTAKSARKVYAYVDDPIDVLRDDFYIDHLFRVDGEQQSEAEAQAHWQRRQLMRDVLLLLFTLYPPDKQHTWQDCDFRMAADFYRSAYPVSAELARMTFPDLPQKRKRNQVTRKDEFYRLFRWPYETWADNPQLPLAQGREMLAELRKKQRKNQQKNVSRPSKK